MSDNSFELRASVVPSPWYAEPPVSVFVKICGITRIEDAEWALECGADALGFVFEKSSPRYVGESEESRSIPHRFGLFARCVAVFATLPDHVKLPFGYAAVQAAEGDDFPINHWAVRAVRTRPELTVEDALDSASIAQAILIDAYDPIQHGGTGKRADWNFAEELVRASSKSVILAGGLSAANVAEAISHANPYGVDVSSGVESGPGIKDREKVRDFIQAAKGAKG